MCGKSEFLNHSRLPSVCVYVLEGQSLPNDYKIRRGMSLRHFWNTECVSFEKEMHFHKHCLYNFSVCVYILGDTLEVTVPSSSHKMLQNLLLPQDYHLSLDSVQGEWGWLFELPLYLNSGAMKISVMWQAWPLRSILNLLDMCSKFQTLLAGLEVSALNPRCNTLSNSAFHF